MTERPLPSILLLLCVAMIAYGQKPEPTSRKLDVPPGSTQFDSLVHRSTVPLPKLDLPEFIITGVASVELPMFEKELTEENIPETPDLHPMIGMLARENPHLDLPERKRRDSPFQRPSSGSARASIGTFFTSELELWLGKKIEQVDYQLSGNYSRTNGYATGTDRSRGNAAGGIQLTVPDGPRLGISLGYEADRYQFFGSLHPLSPRHMTSTQGGFSLSFPELSSFRVDVGIDQEGTTVRDSSTSVAEHFSHLRIEARRPTPIGTLRGGIHYRKSSIDQRRSEAVSNLKLFLATDRHWWHDIFVEAGLAAYFSDGSGTQFAVAPHLAGGYRLNEHHALSVDIQSRRDLESLRGYIRRNMYLSAQTGIPITHTKVDLSVGLESRWLPWLTSKVTVRYARAENDPLYVDSTLIGVWVLKSDGITRRTSARIEVFANVVANDYFGVVLMLQKGAKDGGVIPYLPVGELTATYTRQFPFGLTVTPQFSYTGKRWIDEARNRFLPGFAILGVEACYHMLERLSAVVRVDNLTDTRYELWKGYRAAPFMLHAGIRYTW